MSERCDPLNRQGRMRRAARSILDGLEPKHRQEPVVAHLLDPAAETLDLLDDGFEHGDRGWDSDDRRSHDEIDTEQGDMPALPLHPDRTVADRRLDRPMYSVSRLRQFICRGRRL